MTAKVDFSDCKTILGKAYNGANGKKIAIEYEGHPYMLKFPPSGEKKPTALSYTNSCISEHIASSIFNMLGVKAQETMLGTFKVGAKIKLVCACRDFTEIGLKLFDFCSIKNTILDSDSDGSGTELEDVLDTIERQRYVAPDRLAEHFWNMFVIDALLGNFDRHNGNWGFLFDDKKNEAEIAPIYDCGSCLLPQADEKIMNDILTDENALNARIYQFPTSALRQNRKKINYYDFLRTTENTDCRKAVKRVVPRVNLAEIDAFIDDVPYITVLQKAFYKCYIEARYEQILQPALEIALCNTQESTQSMHL